jgi:hypothetical protein
LGLADNLHLDHVGHIGALLLGDRGDARKWLASNVVGERGVADDENVVQARWPQIGSDQHTASAIASQMQCHDGSPWEF